MGYMNRFLSVKPLCLLSVLCRFSFQSEEETEHLGAVILPCVI